MKPVWTNAIMSYSSSAWSEKENAWKDIKVVYWNEIVKKFGAPHGYGLESVYWRLDDHVGVKAIRLPFRLPNGGGNTFHTCTDALYVSPKWKEAQRQFDLMQELAKRKRCPAPVELIIICDDRSPEIGHLFMPAIVMEHISFREGYYTSKDVRYRAYHRFLQRMGKSYIVNDTHTGNIVFDDTKKRFMVLDLGGVEKRG